ncbi:MAG: MFS transporter [Hydrogenophaga sp.]|nr:MFS transporter [Hydrogenophaga sp.]
MHQEPSTASSKAVSGSVAVLVVGLGVSCALHVGKLPVAIPLLQEELSLTLVQAGFLLSLVQLAGMSVGLLVGLMADRLGPRRVMTWGLCILAGGSLLGAGAGDLNALLLSRVVEGAGFLMAVLPAPALLRTHLASPISLARALGWWGTYMPMGTSLALLLGVPFLATIGWRGTWILLAALSLGAAAALSWRVPNDSPSGAVQALWPRLARTLRARGPWLVALCFLMYSGQWLAVIGFLPTIYSQGGYGASEVGLLSALAAAVNMLGNIAGGRWLAHHGRPGVMLWVGYAVMGCGALLAFGADGYPVVQYLSVLCFSAFGGLIPGTLFGVAVAVAPGRDTVSTTVGWMQQFSSMGQFLGPPAVAWWVLQAGGWTSTWILTGACSAVGLGLASKVQRVWEEGVSTAS